MYVLYSNNREHREQRAERTYAVNFQAFSTCSHSPAFSGSLVAPPFGASSFASGRNPTPTGR